MNKKQQTITIPISEVYIGSTDLVPTPEEVQQGQGIDVDSNGVPVDLRWCHIGAMCGNGTWDFLQDESELDAWDIEGLKDQTLVYDNSCLSVSVEISQPTYIRLSHAICSSTAVGPPGGSVDVR